MTGNQVTEAVLFITTLLSGFYAGTGFFVAMGGNPAIRQMTGATFSEYWQHTDHFMAARMKVFGPILLLTAILGVWILIKEYRSLSFLFMLAALGILIADLVFVFSVNHPLNQIVQSWDLDRLPANVSEIKLRIASAFNIRLVFMISSFVMVLLALWFHRLQ